MHILNVEDDAVTARAVELMLKKEGHGCTTASLGADAVELAQKGGYDLVLLDVMLPDIDGFAVLERLMAAGVNLPYVMTSGLVDQDSNFRALAFGGTPHVVKPIDRRNLMSQIEAALKAWRSNGQTSATMAAGWTEAPEPPDDDRRQHRRFRTVKKATILEGQGIDCTVTNLSHNGAAIRLPDPAIQCPESFDLRLLTGLTYHCQMRWRNKDRLGVSLLKLK